MATIIKLKRSELALAIPTVNDLAVGELAINSIDKIFYIRKSNDEIVPVANYVDIDPSEIDTRLDAVETALLGSVFPSGDYGDLDALTVDAFGVLVSRSYDCLTTPVGSLLETDLESL